MFKVHELKTWIDSYEAIETLRKRLEVRVDDREFDVGDLLVLREYDSDRGDGMYTGRVQSARVTHILEVDDVPGFFIQGFAIMSIGDVESLCEDFDDDWLDLHPGDLP